MKSIEDPEEQKRVDKEFQSKKAIENNELDEFMKEQERKRKEFESKN